MHNVRLPHSVSIRIYQANPRHLFVKNIRPRRLPNCTSKLKTTWPHDIIPGLVSAVNTITGMVLQLFCPGEQISGAGKLRRNSSLVSTSRDCFSHQGAGFPQISQVGVDTALCPDVVCDLVCQGLHTPARHSATRTANVIASLSGQNSSTHGRLSINVAS